NIVTVYDCLIGENEQPYVVMDYLRGKSLEALIEAEGPLNVDRFARIVVQICSALDHAHKKGIVHRDLKPGNIVLMDEEMDFVKVVDFGLARLGQDGRKLTNTGELWGSPPYMSPEQCKGEAVDERSDLYSMGCVMYEMLTGRDPFYDSVTVFELIQKHVNVPPPPLARANQFINVPSKIEQVIHKAMSKEPGARYQTANELQDAVIEACSGEVAKESRDYLYHLATQTRPKTGSQQNFASAPDEISSSQAVAQFAQALNPARSDPQTGPVDLDGLFAGASQQPAASPPAAAPNSAPNSKWARDAAFQPGGPAANREHSVSNQSQATESAPAAAGSTAPNMPPAAAAPAVFNRTDGPAIENRAGTGRDSARDLQNSRSRYGPPPSSNNVIAGGIFGACAMLVIFTVVYFKPWASQKAPVLDKQAGINSLAEPKQSTPADAKPTGGPPGGSGRPSINAETPAAPTATTAAPVTATADETDHHLKKPLHTEKASPPRKKHTAAATLNASASESASLNKASKTKASSSKSGSKTGSLSNPWSLLDQMRKPGK
ncbi:MAG TPA: serine/threonine-protein kinase, partial [Chroococcales cyanobacterium]